MPNIVVLKDPLGPSVRKSHFGRGGELGTAGAAFDDRTRKLKPEHSVKPGLTWNPKVDKPRAFVMCECGNWILSKQRIGPPADRRYRFACEFRNEKWHKDGNFADTYEAIMPPWLKEFE